jgi:hypothetical protein
MLVKIIKVSPTSDGEAKALATRDLAEATGGKYAHLPKAADQAIDSIAMMQLARHESQFVTLLQLNRASDWFPLDRPLRARPQGRWSHCEDRP